MITLSLFVLFIILSGLIIWGIEEWMWRRISF